MNNCSDPKWRAFKIIDDLRGKVMKYFDTHPEEVGKDGELLCKEMFSYFGYNEQGLTLRSKLYQVAQKGGSHRRRCGSGTMYGGDGISFLGKSRGRIICGRVLSQRTLKQDDFPDCFGQGPRRNRKGSGLGKEI